MFSKQRSIINSVFLLLLVGSFWATVKLPVFAGVLLNAAGNDDLGDAFGPKNFDLRSMVASVDSTAILFRLTFDEDISVDINDANYVAGFIDLDLDRNLFTDIDGLRLSGVSGGSNVEFYADGSGEDFSGASLGTDLYVDLFAWSSSGASFQVEIVDVRAGNFLLGFADLQLVSPKELSISISQSLFSQSIAADSFNFGAIVGAVPTTSDPFASDVAVGILGNVNPPVIPEPTSIFVFAFAATLCVRCRSR